MKCELCTRSEESATGPPGKFQDGKFDVMFFLTTTKNLLKLKKKKKEKEHNQIYCKEENTLQLLWLSYPPFLLLASCLVSASCSVMSESL